MHLTPRYLQCLQYCNHKVIVVRDKTRPWLTPSSDDVMTCKHFPHYWPFVWETSDTSGFLTQRASNVTSMYFRDPYIITYLISLKLDWGNPSALTPMELLQSSPKPCIYMFIHPQYSDTHCHIHVGMAIYKCHLLESKHTDTQLHL